MKVIKKYTAIQVRTQTVNDNILPELIYGEITGPYYDREYPETQFDTEEKAIEWAYKTEKYGNWLILPIISFDNH
jgi:hypothetical protein